MILVYQARWAIHALTSNLSCEVETPSLYGDLYAGCTSLVLQTYGYNPGSHSCKLVSGYGSVDGGSYKIVSNITGKTVRLNATHRCSALE